MKFNSHLHSDSCVVLYDDLVDMGVSEQSQSPPNMTSCKCLERSGPGAVP